MKKKRCSKGFKNALEEHVAALNANVFWREFSFSKNEFFPSPAEPSELADHVVWIEDLLIAYQLKERAAGPRATVDSERKWFERKVLGEATRQVRDTLRYLEEHEEIEIENQRGHVFKVSGRALKKVVKLVLYAPGANLPEDCRHVKHHISSSSAAGLIHILTVQDYTAAKYDLRVRKLVGVSLAREGHDFIINWCLMDSPWEYDAEMEERLRRSYPFLSMKGKYSPRYTFGKGAG